MGALRTFLTLVISSICQLLFAGGAFDSRDYGIKASLKLHMDEGAGAATKNSSVSGPAAPLSNTSWAKGRFNHGINFAAAGARAGSSDAGLPSGSSARSLIIWIQLPPNAVGASGMFAYGTDTTNQRVLIRGQGTAGPATITSDYSGNGQTYTAVTLEPYPAWNMLFYSFSGGNPGIETIMILVNGKIKRGSRSVSGVNTVLTGSSVWVGNFLAAASECDCVMDEVQFYNGIVDAETLYASTVRGMR